MGCKNVGLVRYYTRRGVIEIGNVQKMHVAFLCALEKVVACYRGIG
jgi:hypothetical protein